MEGDIFSALVGIGDRLPHGKVSTSLQLSGLCEQSREENIAGEEERIVGEVVLHCNLDLW